MSCSSLSASSSGGGILVASIGLALILPILRSPGEAVFFVLTILLGELGVIFLFGRVTLGRALFKPMDRLVDDVKTMATGAYQHRVRP
ncbi:MAG: hypothetical protein MUO50_11800, partial [Longimicrobiales bacterium]|nr:hypothetical protein [Longimicrobiales bacterium]